MITRNPTFTGSFICPNYNQIACKMQPRCSHETWLSRNICKTKKKLNLLEKLKLIKESKAKSLRNVGSQFGISVGAVNNFL